MIGMVDALPDRNVYDRGREIDVAKSLIDLLYKQYLLTPTRHRGLQIFTIKQYVTVLFNDIHYNMRLESFRCEGAHLLVRNKLRNHSVQQ